MTTNDLLFEWMKLRCWSAALTGCKGSSLSLTVENSLSHLLSIWLCLASTLASFQWRSSSHSLVSSCFAAFTVVFARSTPLFHTFSSGTAQLSLCRVRLRVLSRRLMICCLHHLCYPRLTALCFLSPVPLMIPITFQSHLGVIVCARVRSAHLSKAHPDMIQTWYICWPLARNLGG